MLTSQSHKHRISRFFSGETIFEEGQSGSVAFCILTGEVELSISRNNRRIVIDTLSQGDYFGELAILLDIPRQVSASASRYTEVQVIHHRELNHLLSKAPSLLRDVMIQQSRRIYRSVDWVEQNQHNCHPLLTAAEVLQLHGFAKLQPGTRDGVTLKYESVVVSIERITGLMLGQVKHLLQCMEEMNFFTTTGKENNKHLLLEPRTLLSRAQRAVKSIGDSLQQQLRSQAECLDMDELTELVGAERDQVLTKLASGGVPDEVLLFHKPAVLALLQSQGKDIFKKREIKPVEQWDCIADLAFADTRTLRNLLVSQEPYTLAIVLQALDENTAGRMLSLISERRRNILQNLILEMDDCDPTEVESIGQHILREVKQTLLK